MTTTTQESAMTETTAPAALPDRGAASSTLYKAAQALLRDVFGDAQASQIPGDDFTVLQPGEVLAIYEPQRPGKYGALGPEDIDLADAMLSKYDLYVVRSVTKNGTLTVEQIQSPKSHTPYLATLPLIPNYTQRMRQSANRLVYRTGRTYDAIREALSASPLRPAFDAALATYTAAVDAENAAWKAEHDAKQAAEAPFVADAEIINTALNWRVASVPGYGTPRVEIDLGGRPIPVRVLRVAMLGRNIEREITDDVLRAGVAALARYEAAKEGR